MKNKFKNLKRRDVLIGSAVLTGAAVLASCDDKIDGGTPDKPKESTSISKNIIQWRMATTWPKNFPGVGTTAENVANKWQITRKDQDHFAFSSQLKAEKARKEKKFKNEIIPAIFKAKNKLEIDEHPR